MVIARKLPNDISEGKWTTCNLNEEIALASGKKNDTISFHCYGPIVAKIDQLPGYEDNHNKIYTFKECINTKPDCKIRGYFISYIDRKSCLVYLCKLPPKDDKIITSVHEEDTYVYDKYGRFDTYEYCKVATDIRTHICLNKNVPDTYKDKTFIFLNGREYTTDMVKAELLLPGSENTDGDHHWCNIYTKGNTQTFICHPQGKKTIGLEQE